MTVNEIKPDTIPTWKAEFLRKEHTNVVLEKIKAEIEALSNANPSYTHTCDVVDREDVLDIIDKYKTESEDEE